MTIGLLLYLGIVLLAPLSNPLSTRDLTAPLAEMANPVHQALYLDHGYRFFAPDPGPSHLVFYEITTNEGRTIEAHFPDADQTWPRLLYHRWFMLSETMYEEYAYTPDKESFDQSQLELATAVDQLRKEGHFGQSDRLKKELVRQRDQYDRTRTRIDGLVSALARHLLEHHGGKEIIFHFRERMIPQPIDIATGSKLDDERYLEHLEPFARFGWTDDGQLQRLAIPTETDETTELLPENLGGGR